MMTLLPPPMIRRVAGGLIITILGLADTVGARVTDTRGTSGLCQAVEVPRSIEHRYTVAARVRPFLVWTRRYDVGRGRFLASEEPAGVRRLELLIGTDPDRAPMHINRWGYVAETICGNNAELIGLMTGADEETIDEARTALAIDRPGHSYKAIRTRLMQGEASTEILRLSTAEYFTYRNLNDILGQLPASGVARRSQVPAGTESGFLVAITSLLGESVEQYRVSGRMGGGSSRVYLYGGGLFSLTLHASTLRPTLQINDRTYSSAIESDFEIRNMSTRTRTDFQITYGTGVNQDVPLRMVYRPRWWLELELQLDSSVGG